MEPFDPAKARARLHELFATRAVKWGKFTLASGRESDFYIDSKEVSLTGEGLWLIGNLVVDRIRPIVVGVGGLTLGADPIACSAALVAHSRGRTLAAFIVRKEAKGHGTTKVVEGLGALPKGSRVTIVEDVITTGGSALVAVNRANESGLHVEQVVGLVDREEGGRAEIEKRGIGVEAIFKRSDFSRGA
ncbi:MAG: orotate phosphoribosyltransferase [Deltaproteobacteria bacterium]|nr:orotate phosphoribosyltransferase [Deltaproteobacteria bacterium]